jgi:BASS family bile acid:Na+ symporter
VLGLILFAIAIMDGVGEMALARPDFAILTIVVAFLANAGLQAIGALVFWHTGKRIAFTIGHMTGNCNMGLVLAMLGSQASAEVAFFFALAQLPMYMLPSIALPIYRRLLPGNGE